MKHFFPLTIFHYLFTTLLLIPPGHFTAASDPACRSTCGSVQVKYPFGTGYGCGSPRFHPHITCSSSASTEQLLLTTHTGSYPISSISYSTSTLTITPPSMSTCSSMQDSPNLGFDWAGPFQLGPSTFLLLSCPPSSTSSLTIKGSPVCDVSYSHLCALIYTCPAVVELGLPLFPPSNTCCVYSPANFNNKGELDLIGLKCGGYSSVVSLGDYPTNPTRWEYGVALKYNYGLLDNIVDAKCNSCEMSGGVCGYDPTGNSFLCVCKNGFNTTMDCYGNNLGQEVFWSSASFPAWSIMWLGNFALIIIWVALTVAAA